MQSMKEVLADIISSLFIKDNAKKKKKQENICDLWSTDAYVDMSWAIIILAVIP